MRRQGPPIPLTLALALAPTDCGAKDRPNTTQDRPTYPPRVQRTEILFDPFDDIVPREKVARARGRARDRARVRVSGREETWSKMLPDLSLTMRRWSRRRLWRRAQGKEKKNLALLFGEEAAEEERAPEQGGPTLTPPHPHPPPSLTLTLTLTLALALTPTRCRRRCRAATTSSRTRAFLAAGTQP